jgi:HK97 family phage portal protein
VRCYRDRATGEKRFDVWTDGRVSRGLTAAEILHVRGPTWAGGLVGMNPIQVHRHALGNAVAMEEFAGRFFRNDARPGVVIEFPQGVTEGQAKAWARAWDAAHAGLDNKHRTGIVGGGASVTTLPVSLEDAQFIEGQRYGVADVARIFRIPKSWLEEGDIGDTAQEVERVTKFSLLPRFRRIERALAADADLFGQPDPYPEFLADALLRPDTERRYRAYKDARQGSWVTANEIRELENLPPIEGGDEIQQTPVGGYPNPGMREEAALNGKAALDRV